MDPAFWDSSSLVPLCIKQQSTPIAQALSKQYVMRVWWGTPVEIRGAFARLLRMGQLTPAGHTQAQVALHRLRSGWHEIEPSEALREQAEQLVDRFPLKAADALQLAAAVTWCSGHSRGRIFVSGDSQLLDAARQLGFSAVEA